MSETPNIFTWTGTSMKPLKGYHAKQCDQTFVVGERYAMAQVYPRSQSSHNHQFAWLREAWINLPETMQKHYPTPDALRKQALIATGWHEVDMYLAETEEEAIRMIQFIKLDDYQVKTRSGLRVYIFTARSQKQRGPNAMSPADFQKSKQDVLEWVAARIGVPTEELKANADQAA